MDKDKKQELTEDAAWHMLVKEADTGKLLAFVHFRFDLDDDKLVTKCVTSELVWNLPGFLVGCAMMAGDILTNRWRHEASHFFRFLFVR